MNWAHFLLVIGGFVSTGLFVALCMAIADRQIAAYVWLFIACLGVLCLAFAAGMK